MINLKVGDITNLKHPETGAPLYYVALDYMMKYKNLPCVFLATDPNNKNTYSRYSIEYLNNHGYNVLLKIKYTHTLYNSANPYGKIEKHITTGAPVAKPDYIGGSNDNTIYLKNENKLYYIEPENIIKFYAV